MPSAPHSGNASSLEQANEVFFFISAVNRNGGNQGRAKGVVLYIYRGLVMKAGDQRERIEAEGNQTRENKGRKDG